MSDIFDKDESFNQLHSLLRSGKKKRLGKGQVIHSSDSKPALSLVNSGYVKRYLVTNEGSLGVQLICGPNEILPFSTVYKVLYNQTLYEGPEIYFYETMSDTEIYTIDAELLIQAALKSQSIYRDLMAEAGKRLRVMVQRLENITLHTYYKRVAHQLFYYAKDFGLKTSSGTEILIPLTQQDLADVLSATRETVSICMVQLRKKGLIKTGKTIIVPDMKKLEEEAYS